MNSNFETPLLGAVNEPAEIRDFTADDLKQLSDASRSVLEARVGNQY